MTFGRSFRGFYLRVGCATLKGLFVWSDRLVMKMTRVRPRENHVKRQGTMGP